MNEHFRSEMVWSTMSNAFERSTEVTLSSYFVSEKHKSFVKFSFESKIAPTVNCLVQNILWINVSSCPLVVWAENLCHKCVLCRVQRKESSQCVDLWYIAQLIHRSAKLNSRQFNSSSSGFLAFLLTALMKAFNWW